MIRSERSSHRLNCNTQRQNSRARNVLPSVRTRSRTGFDVCDNPRSKAIPAPCIALGAPVVACLISPGERSSSASLTACSAMTNRCFFMHFHAWVLRYGVEEHRRSRRSRRSRRRWHLSNPETSFLGGLRCRGRHRPCCLRATSCSCFLIHTHTHTHTHRQHIYTHNIDRLSKQSLFALLSILSPYTCIPKKR